MNFSLHRYNTLVLGRKTHHVERISDNATGTVIDTEFLTPQGKVVVVKFREGGYDLAYKFTQFGNSTASVTGDCLVIVPNEQTSA